MSEAVQVRIIAQDGSSAVFQKIGGSATQMGDAIERAGKDGATGLDRMGQSAQKNATLLGHLRDNAAEVGAAVGAFVSVLTLLGRNSREANLQVDAVNRAYMDQADVIFDLTERVQDYSRFSNDSAREAALTFQTLVDNYGISIQQLDELMIRSADVAQLRSRSLEDVSQMLQNAIRGEAEYAEAVGVTLNDSFLAAEYARRGLGEWTKLTDEMEKAQFRFQVLMEQTAYAAGTAGDQVDNAGGRFPQFINTVDDGAEALGGMLGPIAEIAGEYQALALWAPVAAGMFGQITKGALAARAGVAALAIASSPVTWVLGGVALAGAGVYTIFQNIEASASGVAEGVGVLTEEVERLKLAAQPDVAEQVQGILDLVEAQRELLSGDLADLTAKGVIPEGTDLLQISGPGGLMDDVKTAGQLIDDFSSHIVATLNEIPDRAGEQAYLDWVTTMLAGIEHGVEGSNFSDILNKILLTPASEVPGVMSAISSSTDDAADSFLQARATAAEFLEVFSDFPTMIDDLRLSGEGELANQLESLHTSVVDAFTLSEQDIAAANASYLRMLPAEDAQAALDEMTSKTELTVEQTELLGGAMDRIFSKMSEGNLDNAAVTEEVNRILGDTTLSAEEQVNALNMLSLSLSGYLDPLAAVKDAQIEWLAQGENLLQFWRELDQVVLESTAGIAEAGDGWTQFRETFDLATQIDAANASFDQTLRIFEQIDQLASRPERARSIAASLVGEPGEWAAIDELLEAGRIGLEQYSETVEAGYAIVSSAARQQLILNEIRADQLPLLEAEQLAYERSLEALSHLPAEQQRYALMLQDTAVQAQIAELYSTAYAASIGEIPEHVATDIIVNSAMADPALARILEQMGLIREEVGPNGELTYAVNFPGVDETIQALDRITLAFLNMQAAGDREVALQIATELYGEEEAKELFGLVEENDGRGADIPVTVNQGAGVATVLDDIRLVYERIENLDGTESYVVLRADIETGELEEFGQIVDSYTDPDDPTIAYILVEADTGSFVTTIEKDTGEIGEVRIPVSPEMAEDWQTLADDAFDGGEVVIPIRPLVQQGTIGVGDGTGGAQNWNALLDVPESVTTTIRAVVSGQDEAESVSTAIETIPPSKDSTVSVTVTGLDDVKAAAAAVEGLTDAEVTVSVLGDDSDAQAIAAYWAGYNGITFASITVALEADESDLVSTVAWWGGGADVAGPNGGPSINPVTVPFVADASDLNSALAQWGIGDGGGGGGAADYEPPTVIVDFVADTSELDLENLGLNELYPDGIQIAVTTAGSDEAVSALAGVSSAAGDIPESESVTVVALAEGATFALEGVTAAAGDIPESESVTVNVYGAASAISALNSVANAAANVPGSVSTTITTYRDTVYRTSGNPFAMALGGTVWGDDEPLRAANGRSVWVGEYGPELVSLPHGSQVTPHVASLSAAGGDSTGGGHTFNITVNGSNRDEIYDVFDREIIPSLERAIRQLEAGMGV